MSNKEKWFGFVLKVYRCGFNERADFMKLLVLLGHATTEGTMSTNGREMLECWDLVHEVHASKFVDKVEE